MNIFNSMEWRGIGGWTLAAMLLVPLAASGKEPVPITDPALLEKLGEPAGTQNLFATPGAIERLYMSPEQHAAASEARRAEWEHAAKSPYGTGASGYSAIGGEAFRPVHYNSEFGGTSDSRDERACFGGSPLFHAYVEGLPHGARLERLDVWFYDDTPENLLFQFYSHCLPSATASPPSRTSLDSFTSSGTGGYKFHMGAALSEDVNLEICTYNTRVFLDDSTITCSEGTDLRISKVRVKWVRQVSPAPGTATFNDVPTGHAFFQHVEALAASGVTAGCGGGDFCVNDPLTRGQMAVFLASALGLHWGSF